MRADDAQYLRNKWWPEGSFNLVEMDVSTRAITAKIVGAYDKAWQAGWDQAVGTWVARRTMEVTFTYRNYLLGTMHNLQDFGLLTGFCIIVAFLADALLAPALMMLVAQRQAKQRKEKTA